MQPFHGSSQMPPLRIRCIGASLPAGQQRRVAVRCSRKRRRRLHDRTRVRGMVVASGEESRPGRRAGHVWKALYRRPLLARRSTVGMLIGPPKALDWPNPMSSMRTINTFGRRRVLSPGIAAEVWRFGHPGWCCGGIWVRRSAAPCDRVRVGQAASQSPTGRYGLSGRRASQWRSSSLPRGRPT